MSYRLRNRRLIIKSLSIILLIGFVLLSQTQKCAATYYSGTFEVTYDGYIINTSYAEIEMNVTVASNQTEYNVNITSNIGLSTNMKSFIKDNIIIPIEDARLLPKYTNGIVHTSWLSEKCVYNDSNDIIRVYNAENALLMLMSGVAFIDGKNVTLNIYVIQKNELTKAINWLDSMFWVFAIAVITIVALYFAWIYLIKPKKTNKKIESKISSKSKNVQRKSSKYKLE